MIFNNKKVRTGIPGDEIRRRSRILVIDDNDFAYLGLFTRDGYAIDKWDDVDDLQKIERGDYDVVLLDIQGIGIMHSQEQGLGVLKHIREKSPSQLVIAYSNADFSLKYQEFFQMADATLDKSADYVEFKRTLDELLVNRFYDGFYLRRIEELAEEYQVDVQKLLRLSKKAIKNNNKKKLKKFLEENISNKDVVSKILNIISIAISIAAL